MDNLFTRKLAKIACYGAILPEILWAFDLSYIVGRSMDILKGLNEAQKEAVLQKDGPVLIIAGAGAGKTKTITHRILHLVKSGVAPENILAITFTNKAAKEMKERVMKLLSEERSRLGSWDERGEPFMSTFHSLGVHILKENGREIGLGRHFAILDDNDSLSLVKQAIKKVGLDPKQFEPRRMRNVISKQKGNLLTAERYARNASNEYFPRILSSVWIEYEKLLKEERALDFDDLILKTVLLLEENEKIRSHYQNRFKYIHIDEYQDTNVAQYRLSVLLAERHGNVCVVGDMDQSIYSWRGADFRNILNFEKDFPGVKIVTLEENYRSTENILRAANDIIIKNKFRKEKNLFTRKSGGEKVGFFQGYDENEEARFVAQKTRQLIDGGVKEKDIAVLYRANFQSRVLEEAFLSDNLPYQVLGVKFFERKEVKDILSYVKAALDEESFRDIKRIINVPPRGIGKVGLAKIASGKEKELPASAEKKYSEFKKVLSEIRSAAETKKASEVVKTVLKKTGIEDMLKNGSEEEQERLENLRELVTLATKYDIYPGAEGLEKMLTDAALSSDQDSLFTAKEKEHNAVRLMTVHASKGLEFQYVFVTGLEDGLFPHNGFGGENKEERGEEERRLFYVALTRAQKKIFLSYANLRTIFGSKQVNVPSEFLSDISEEILEEEFLL